jgi:hypothetical protein
MKNQFYFGTAAIAMAVVATAPAYAQETTSSVRGVVTSAGKAVSGADVTVTHEPSGTTASSTTDADGGFNVNGLRVGGPFTVKVAASGFEDSSVTDIFLSAGQPFRLPVDIQQASEIVVTAARTKAVDVSNGPITALDRVAIEGAASVNRDIRDLARRDPLVTMDLSNSRTIEVAGQNGRLNRFSVDGVQFSDDFGLNNGGLPTSRGPVPFDAIEQFSVKVAPFDIAEGDFQGGAINVVLRSGGNKLHGSAFYTFTDDSLTGSNVRGTPVNLEFDSKQYGGVLTGPLIKDKLFFMVAYEKTKEKDPFDDGIGAGFANQVPGITQAQIDNVTSIANTVYGYDTLGQIQNAVEQDEKIIAKLDWNVNDDHRVSATYIRNVGTQQFQQNTFTTAPFALGLFSNGYELAEEVNSGVVQLNSTWSDNLSTEARVSYRDYKRDQTPFGGREFGQFEVCLDPTSINSGSNTATSCGGSRLFFGPDVSRQSNDLNTSNLSADFTAKYVAGAHSIKAMVGYTRIKTFNLFLQRSLGDFYFDSVADLQARAANRVRLGGAVPSLDPNDAAAAFSTSNYTFGIQDDWEVADNLMLNIGARYDLFSNDSYPILNSNFLARQGYTNQATFNGRGVFQPRFGFNWTPTDQLVVRGGVGIFAGGTPDVFLSNSFSNTGQLTNAVDINRSNCVASGNTCDALNGVTGSSFPASITNFLATNTASLAAAPVNAIDPDLKIARQMKASLSIDYDADLGPLGEGWLFGVQGLYSKNIQGYNWVDARSVPVGTLPDGRLRYGPIGGTATTNQDLIMTNSTRGYSFAAVARIAKSWDFGLSIDASYTRTSTKDQNALTSATAGSLYSNNAFLNPNEVAYGTSIYQIRDQYKFGVDFKREFFGDNATRISLFGEYRSGRPYSVVALDNTTGRLATYGTVGNGGRVLLYVPTAGDTKVVFDTPASAAAFDTLVTTLGLEKYRGKVVAKNSQRSPDFFKVDMHVEQEVPGFLTKEAKFKVFADIENLLNLIDSDWGSLRQVAFPYTASVVRVACAATTGTNCTQYRYSNVLSPNVATVTRPSLYAIRVGVKFQF